MAKLDPKFCTARLQRLTQLLETHQLDAILLGDYRDIYYFTGTLLPADLPVLLVINDAGSTILTGPAGFVVDGVETQFTYEWSEQGTRHSDPVSHLANLARQNVIDPQWRQLGIQIESFLHGLRQALPSDSKLVPIDEAIREMQSRKDPDEVELIRESIRANLGAYAAVQQAIRPGVTELNVLAAGIQGAMATAGEKVFHDGDYQCGQFNGPARNRRIEAGELYIVDAWTCYRGYWSDMSRTFVVGREPTDVQRGLFDHIQSLQKRIPQLLRPGVDGSEVFRSLDEMIREHPPLADQGLVHHGGHASGLRAHEMPDINRDRGGKLEPGNVICVEPGGYFDEARQGVRLENMYLITADGCEDLCAGEVELHRCG